MNQSHGSEDSKEDAFENWGSTAGGLGQNKESRGKGIGIGGIGRVV